ncbi:hypothetical protein CRE_22865 [Caenorhabditis remanei]|uniref:Tc1-like transposase DDE domain-containing protein n=1 Tax=Caenorhabditis remanei TaxID=31234 RepID=E3MHM2_CAERE|nr:hypothetical protein CRE_22865 [Caenorhabditis remanei]
MEETPRKRNRFTANVDEALHNVFAEGVDGLEERKKGSVLESGAGHQKSGAQKKSGAGQKNRSRKKKAIAEEAEKKKKKEEMAAKKKLEQTQAIGMMFMSLKFEEFSKQTRLNEMVRCRGEDLVSNFRDAALFIKNRMGKLAGGTIFNNVAQLGVVFLGVDRSTVLYRSERLTNPAEARAGRKVKLSRKQLRRRAASELTPDDKKQLLGYLQTCWKEEKPVTLLSLLEWAREAIDFQYGKSTLGYVLGGMGLAFRMKSHNPIVEERKDLIKLREIFLRKMENLKSQNAYLSYFDETWVYQGMVLKRAGQFSSSTMYQRARLLNPEAPVPGPKKGASRGKRGIVAAVVTEEGVLKGSEQVWVSSGKLEDQTADNHSEMNSDLYEEYIKTRVLPELIKTADSANRPPVLVIDNAPYHNRYIDKDPTKSCRKGVIIDWLSTRGVSTPKKAKKPQVVKMLENYIDSKGGRDVFKRYVVDEYAKSLGVTVIRVPPYHYFLNPIELMWSQLKHEVMKAGTTSTPLAEVREKITISKLSIFEVRQNTLQFLRNFSAESSMKLFQHVSQIEEEVRIKIKERSSTTTTPSTPSDSSDVAELDDDGDWSADFERFLIDNEDDLDTQFDQEDETAALKEIEKAMEDENDEGDLFDYWDSNGNVLFDSLSSISWLN